MKCIYCSAPLPKKGLNCSYCNKLNPLNAKLLESAEKLDSKYLCPCCNLNLETLKTSTISLEYCKECDGIFIAEEEFETLIAYKVNLRSKFPNLTPITYVSYKTTQETSVKSHSSTSAPFAKRLWLW